jgi:hypothetical protein
VLLVFLTCLPVLWQCPAPAVAAEPVSNIAYAGLSVKPRKQGGLIVAEVLPDTAAERAQLAKGDVIHEFGDATFGKENSSPKNLFAEIKRWPVGKAVRTVFERDGEKQVTYVRIGERPSLRLNVSGHKGQGIKVMKVGKGGIGEYLGIQKDDLIVGYRGKTYSGTNLKSAELAREISRSPFDVPIDITLDRDGKVLSKEVTYRRTPQAQPAASSEQQQVIEKFGPPESFTVMIIAEDEETAPERNEVWKYYSLGRSFTFVEGKLITSHPLQAIDSQAALPDYRPWQFTGDMGIGDAVTAFADQEFIQLDLDDELIEGGTMAYSEQLALGFKDGQLVFAESIPLVPGEEGGAQ